MNLKKRVSGATLVGVLGLGLGAGAEPVKTAPSPQKVTAPATQETVTLARGKTRDLTLSGLTRVAVGDPSIADVKVLGASLLRITAGKAGKTTVIVWKDKGERREYPIIVNP